MLVTGNRPSAVGGGILKPAVSDPAELARAAEAGESDPWPVLTSYLEPFFEFTGSRERISLRGGDDWTRHDLLHPLDAGAA